MLRVMIADDEPIERMVVTKKIQKNFDGRLEVVQAENGEEAVELFFSEGCSIAILDINMPGMSGLEAAAKIREADNACSIIFLTAYDEFGYAKKAFSVRALDYLLKPGSDDELIAVLEEAIRLARKAQQKTLVQKENRHVESAEEEKNADNARMRAVAGAIGDYLQQHYAEDISLQDIAGTMGYSDAYFSKIFKQCFDKNFTVYLTELRVELAKQMLPDLGVNIKEIGTRVGFHDSNYFTRVFKRTTGMTPSEYRNHVIEESGKI